MYFEWKAVGSERNRKEESRPQEFFRAGLRGVFFWDPHPSIFYSLFATGKSG